MRILLYLGIILIGAWLGAGGRLSERFTGRLSLLQFSSLLLMLFVMGVNIGANDNVVKGFYKLGFQAAVLAAFSIAFSIFAVKLVSGFVERDERKSE